MKKLLIIFLAIAFLGFTGLGVSLAGEEDKAQETQEQKKAGDERNQRTEKRSDG